MARLRHRATTHRQTRGCPDDMPALQGGRSGEEPRGDPFPFVAALRASATAGVLAVESVVQTAEVP